MKELNYSANKWYFAIPIFLLQFDKDYFKSKYDNICSLRNFMVWFYLTLPITLPYFIVWVFFSKFIKSEKTYDFSIAGMLFGVEIASLVNFLVYNQI